MVPQSNRFRSPWLAACLTTAIVVTACGGAVATVAPTAVPATVQASAAALPTAGASVSGSASATAEPTPAVTAVAVTAPVTAAPGTAAPPTAPPVTEAPSTLPPPTAAPGVGVAQQIGDEQLMTVVQAEQWPGTSSVKPRSGKTFFTVSIRIDALRVTSFDSADFKLKDAAGHLYSWRTGRSPHLYDLANMSAGNNYVGWITYEIPKSALVGLILVYKPRFLGGATFAVPVS